MSLPKIPTSSMDLVKTEQPAVEEKKHTKSVNTGYSKNKSKKNKNVVLSDGTKLPKTAQDTVPFVNAYRSGIIESSPNFFTKSYTLADINFSVASIEEQEKIFEKYRKFLDSFDGGKKIQIIINNRNVDENKVLDTVLCKMQRDNLNDYRAELNDIIKDKMSEGRNNLVSEKYLVIGNRYNSIKEAKSDFSRLDVDVDHKFKEMSGSQDLKTSPQSIQERLKCLHDILNIGKEENLSHDIDFDELAKAGLSVKDIISPAGFRFDATNFRIGEKWAQALFIKDIPSSFSTDFMADISGLPFNLTASFNIVPIASDEAIKKVRNRTMAIKGNVIKAQKDASKNGYSSDLISSNLKFASEQAENLMDDLRNSEQKLYFFNSVIMHYADSKEELKVNSKSIITTANKYLVSIENMLYMQEEGFRCALPLGRSDFLSERTIPTDGAALFIPFTTKELIQEGGMYYGLNAVSNNLLLFNRLKSKNQNGLILGESGSGKSFACKRELVNVYLTTNDDIYVIDPESEYTTLATRFGGAVIRLETGSHVYINPFDMDINYGDGENDSNVDPVKLKSDYICMLCETALGGRFEITNIQRSIIDRVVIELYKPYMKHMRDLNNSITCDKSASPTMDMFYELLMQQAEPEAQNIALSLEIYCRGSFDTFAHRTNVDIDNRFTVYDIKNIGNGMKEMGLQVCLNHIWNKIIDNQRINKKTWFYIDEFHLLTKTRSSAEFLMQIWKRARKWGGIPTAITQNIEDLLNNEASRAIINNCEFIMILSQSPIDRAALAQMYHISDAQLTFITSSPPGQGLLYTGANGIVPFIDKFPEDTELFKLMSSKSDERL